MRSLLALLLTCTLAQSADLVRYAPYYPNVPVQKPVKLVRCPDQSGRLFLVQQRGQIIILPKDESSAQAQVFLDLSQPKMESADGEFEEGLLGLAFHPEFASNGKFYVCYTAQQIKRVILAEFHVSKDNPDKADPTPRVLIENPKPHWNHNSGQIEFGPDGMLYVCIGDGGAKGGGDPLRMAQNTFVLNGKILRIDVNRAEGSLPYGIPPDNPFVTKPLHRPEIYAYGLRNPWGISFDHNGKLWVADVGQELNEEVNLIKSGGNYGWNFREGAEVFPRRTDAPPEKAKFIEPVHSYRHTDGISITGGFTYRGTAMPKLTGCYLFGDFGFGTLWALRYDKDAKKVTEHAVIYTSPMFDAAKKDKGEPLVKPTAFHEDAAGEPIVLDWSGKMWRLLPADG